MAKYDLVMHEIPLEHLSAVSEQGDSACESSKDQQVDPETGLSPNLESPDSLSERPAHPGLLAPKHWHLAMFEIGKPLGRGRLGRVYLVKERSSGFICALKVLYKHELTDVKSQEQVKREIEIQSRLTHPNVLRLFGHFHDRHHIFLILEYAGGGELYKHLRKKWRFSEQEAAQYIAQTTAALEYIHKKHIMHRDIKPENILLGVHGEAKVSDFGSSVRASAGRRTTICGTLDYMAPEILASGSAGNCYDDKTDVWSLGVLLYELLVGHAPFEDMPILTKKRIVTGDFQVPDSVSADAKNLIERLLVVDPEVRISMQEIVRHPWLLKYTGGF
ncbi:spindle assembly checkpoint kinase [Didymella pomorum]